MLKTEQGVFCLRVMPLGLRNAGATYLLDRGLDRLVNKMLHDMIGMTMEGYFWILMPDREIAC